MPAPTLTDGVVQLGVFGPGDVDAHLANEDEETARRFGWWPKRSTAHNVRDAFDRWAGSWASGGPIRVFAVRDVATATLVGTCELRLEDDQVVRASYSIGPRARRRGFASRALQLAMQWAFDCVDVARVELYIESDNVASRGASRGAAALRLSRRRCASRPPPHRRRPARRATVGAAGGRSPADSSYSSWVTDVRPSIRQEIDRYLRTGETDPHYMAWTGGFMDRAKQAHDDLRRALAGEVTRLATGLTQEPVTEADTVALTRRKVEPMVRGLFPRAEQDVVLAAPEKSVVPSPAPTSNKSCSNAASATQRGHSRTCI